MTSAVGKTCIVSEKAHKKIQSSDLKLKKSVDHWIKPDLKNSGAIPETVDTTDDTTNCNGQRYMYWFPNPQPPRSNRHNYPMSVNKHHVTA